VALKRPVFCGAMLGSYAGKRECRVGMRLQVYNNNIFGCWLLLKVPGAGDHRS
jgi:hypothetical protein